MNGRLRRTTDANGYYQSFVYDAAGSLKAVIDSEQRQRFSAEYVYGADAYQIETSDPDLGSRTQEYDSLGQLRHWTNAEDQHFYATYDPLSRPLTRTEPDHSSGWVWGNDANLHNIGRLQSVSSTANGATYQESFVYDALARLATRTITIPGDNSYQYAYAYNAVNGALDVITYPVSTSSYRLRVKHNYTSAGILQSISDADVPATVFWTANEVDARGWVTQETLGNGIVIRRTYDPITGWLSSIQSGTSGNPAAVQNTSYLYDLVGNVTQRQNNNLGLTENFYYGSPVDNLYRLSYSTLNGTTNLSLTYDELGNILTKNEPGHHDLTIDHAVAWTSYNYPSQISALGETASFEYGPSRQRWKMMYSGIGGNETTYYIGGMMEKVVRGSTSDYRHYVTAGGRAVALYTRRSDGQNALRYALGDHQGSVETITNSDGSVLENASFTAYGNRRSSETWSGAPSATERANLDEVTRQGYTFQTVLGMMGMNHMNGRVQDSITGRFLSPDPFITNPGYTQNYNRYSYVYNNPLTYSDPTGFAVKNKDCGREGSGCQPTPEEIQEIINASTTTVVVNGSRINPFQRAYWTAWDLNRAASLATGVLLTPSFEEGGASDATSEEPIDEVITEAKKCTVSDFVKDLINALKEQLWKNARLDFAVSVDAMWGAGNAQEGSFSHYATSFGVNTFGQFYVQQQGSSSLNGAGAIAAAEVGGEVGVGMGPLTGGPPQTVATGAFSLYALRGFTLGGEVGSQDASLDAPLPEAGSFKPHTGFGFGAATYWGQEREFTLASPPFLGLISPPGDYSGC